MVATRKHFRPGAEGNNLYSEGERIPVSVFVSHSNRDASFAIDLAEKLNKAGFRAWTYETCLKFSKDIREEVWRIIADCDVFIVVDSAAARASGWVARELDKAEELQRKREGKMPAIIFIQMQNNLAPSFARKGFNTALPKGSYNLENTRRFCVENAHTDQIDHLIASILPDVQFFGMCKGDSERMPEGWVECYEALFPIKEERDAPADIMQWMEETAEEPNSEWEELVSTLSIVDYVVGMMYISMHKSSGWIFGNYFGLRNSWRHHNWAKLFRNAIDAHVRARLPHARGIIFEVEPFSDKVVASATQAIKRGRKTLSKKEVGNARSVRRASLYQANGARALMAGTTPAFYKQPYMYEAEEFDGVLDRKAEVPLILMMYPLGEAINPEKHDPRSAIEFVWKMFADGYGGAPAYDAYLVEVREEILAKLPPDACWNRVLSPEAREFVLELKNRKIEVRL
jgi:hypothetical protein